jgi:branched-chain amino acid transport system permease protein
VFLHPNNMDGVFVTGFTAAVIGGLDSPVGALVGGLGLGIVLSWVSGYVGGDLVTLAALVALIAVLMVRPNGIFSRAAVRRV